MVASETADTALKTPLYDLIVAQQAKMTQFAGWEMPIQFNGLKQEHEAVRTSVGMFDISHMGKLLLRGKDLLRSLQSLVPSNLERLQPGQAQYTVVLNPKGGIVDDVIFYLQEAEKGILIVNASTTEKDKAWLLPHLEKYSVTLEDLSQENVLIALQGPQAQTILQSLASDDLSRLKLFEHLVTTLDGAPAFIARTGYTGEDGFEIMLSPEAGQKLWQALLEAGVTPCGLGARDTLRLEAALALYGQDIDDGTSPLEAGLGWLVHLKEKGDFVGRPVLEAQKKQGLSRRLVGLQMEGRYIARHDYPVWSEGKQVGQVTSGTLSPTLGKAIALAYVPVELADLGQTLEVEIRGKTHRAVVVKKPFYKR